MSKSACVIVVPFLASRLGLVNGTGCVGKKNFSVFQTNGTSNL